MPAELARGKKAMLHPYIFVPKDRRAIRSIYIRSSQAHKTIIMHFMKKNLLKKKMILEVLVGEEY